LPGDQFGEVSDGVLVLSRVHGQDAIDFKLLHRRRNRPVLCGAAFILFGFLCEAEPLLVGSFSALKAIPGGNDPRTAESLHRLVELYTRWGRSGEADRYLALVPRPGSLPARTSSPK